MKTPVTLHGINYSIGKLDAFTQMHVARRIGPVVNVIEDAKIAMYADGTLSDLEDTTPAGEVGADALERATRIMYGMMKAAWTAMGQMSQEDADYVMFTCLGVVQRQGASGEWANVLVGKQPAFSDMGGHEMMRLVVEVVKENLSSFFPLLSGMPSSSADADTSDLETDRT